MPLPYYGGKSREKGMAQWIASMLPEERMYVEPFAGMAGVLLARKPAKVETLNDLDENIYVWWKICRERNDELVEKLMWTPFSSALFAEVKNTDWSGKDELWRAWAMTIILEQGWGGVPDPSKARFGWAYKRRVAKSNDKLIAKIGALRERLIDVQLYNVDAVGLLQRIAHIEDTVIYCDPPYHSSATKDYSVAVDKDKLAEALLAQRGKAAISGYPGEWDSLGWHSTSCERYAQITGNPNSGGPAHVQEVLWTNYAPPDQRGLF